IGITAAALDQARVLEARHALPDTEFTHDAFSDREKEGREARPPLARRYPRGTAQTAILFRRAQFLGDDRCEISEHAVGAGALEGHEAFPHGAFAIEPAVLRGGVDHRVLARHLI